jgi:3-deoxy-D-manno-octulosonic-acid transferase
MPTDTGKNPKLMLFGYNLAMLAGALLGMPAIFLGVTLFEKRRKTVLKRLGFTTVPRLPASRPGPIWVHALSVGEVMAAVPLVRALKGRFPDHPLVLSVSTWAGFQLAGRRVKGIEKPVFFFPFDFAPSVRSVIRRIDPAAVLIIETDLWPNFIFSLRKRRTPLILANARISPDSYARYRRFRFLTRTLFGALAGVCAPTTEDARRFSGLGVAKTRIRVTGNLKFEQPATSPVAPADGEWKESLGFSGDPKIIVAGSTHKGEETQILQAFVTVRKAFPKTRIVLAPRDPGRAKAVCRLAESLGIRAFLFSERSGGRSKNAACLVVDRLGVLKRIYAVADVVFVGGSFVKEGGHNPLEPAAWGKPVLFGPDMSDFSSIAGTLLEAGAAVRVPRPELLATEMLRLMNTPETARAMGRAARRTARKGKGAAEKIVEVVAAILWEGNKMDADPAGVDFRKPPGTGPGREGP